MAKLCDSVIACEEGRIHTSARLALFCTVVAPYTQCHACPMYFAGIYVLHALRSHSNLPSY